MIKKILTLLLSLAITSCNSVFEFDEKSASSPFSCDELLNTQWISENGLELKITPLELTVNSEGKTFSEKIDNGNVYKYNGFCYIKISDGFNTPNVILNLFFEENIPILKLMMINENEFELLKINNNNIIFKKIK